MAELTLFEDGLIEAANAIKSCGAILITAGAGMSVDSGLLDYTGPRGLWKAYLPLRGRN